MLPVSNVWKTFCQTGENLPRIHAAVRCQLKRLAELELDLFQLLIKCRPSRTLYKGIKENIEVQSMATALISTIGRAVEGPVTRRDNDLEKDNEASRRKMHP